MMLEYLNLDNRYLKIGIIGRSRTGKDTVAEILKAVINNNAGIDEEDHVYITQFSKGIHDVIKLIMPEAYNYGKPRKALQGIGQEARKHKPDVWIDYTLRDMPDDKNIIITDVRQENEVKRLREEGFFIVKTYADTETILQRMKEAGDNFNEDVLSHETEQYSSEVEADVTIYNMFSKTDLVNAVRDAFYTYLLPQLMYRHEGRRDNA